MSFLGQLGIPMDLNVGTNPGPGSASGGPVPGPELPATNVPLMYRGPTPGQAPMLDAVGVSGPSSPSDRAGPYTVPPLQLPEPPAPMFSAPVESAISGLAAGGTTPPAAPPSYLSSMGTVAKGLLDKGGRVLADATTKTMDSPKPLPLVATGPTPAEAPAAQMAAQTPDPQNPLLTAAAKLMGRGMTRTPGYYDKSKQIIRDSTFKQMQSAQQLRHEGMDDLNAQDGADAVRKTEILQKRDEAVAAQESAMAQFRQERRAKEEKGEADLASLERDIAGKKIDPLAVFRGPGGAMTAVVGGIAAALSAAGNTLARTGGPNAGLQALDTLTNNSIAAQKAEIDKMQGGAVRKRNLLADMRARFGNEEQAMIATKLAIRQGFVDQAETMAAASGSQRVLAGAKILRADMDQKDAEMRYQFIDVGQKVAPAITGSTVKASDLLALHGAQNADKEGSRKQTDSDTAHAQEMSDRMVGSQWIASSKRAAEAAQKTFQAIDTLEPRIRSIQTAYDRLDGADKASIAASRLSGNRTTLLTDNARRYFAAVGSTMGLTSQINGSGAPSGSEGEQAKAGLASLENPFQPPNGLIRDRLIELDAGREAAHRANGLRPATPTVVDAGNGRRVPSGEVSNDAPAPTRQDASALKTVVKK